MNKLQKRVIAIAIPLVLLVASYGVASSALDNACPYKDELAEGMTVSQCSVWRVMHEEKDISAFDIGQTWWLWGLGLLVIVGSEFYLFKD